MVVLVQKLAYSEQKEKMGYPSVGNGCDVNFDVNMKLNTCSFSVIHGKGKYIVSHLTGVSIFSLLNSFKIFDFFFFFEKKVMRAQITKWTMLST